LRQIGPFLLTLNHDARNHEFNSISGEAGMYPFDTVSIPG